MLIYPEIPPQINLKAALDFFYQMPYTLLHNYYSWYIPSSKAEEELLESINLAYRDEAKWLAHYWFIDRNPLSNRDRSLSKAKAEISIHQLCICLQLSQYSQSCKNTFPICEFNHLWLWLFLQSSSCLEDLRNRGIPDGTPKIVSKTDKVRYQSTSISKYSLSTKTLAHQRKDPSIKIPKVKFRESPAADFDFKHDFHHLIHTWAYRLAEQNKRFRMDYWEPYLRKLSSFNCLVEKNPSIQSRYLMPSGEIFTTGKHIKIPKGFGIKL
ncbi:hypothetical protein [Pseudanabaena sp. ABRG5-3]|uniref:hypothetical protein n=1 Tax=Pseudanabaena sp. ABRG5-3 TaxID=685565 RepID=UPI000F824A9A|nr:hypothetical protein [Pseudanabaena sp. ABRG5-3]